ncbi:MAG: hypothetical protein IKP77_02755 [Acholeplasmatales bacterium]|nr:hypothetical protein [Acholeplasmatales bacterium]
MFNSNNWREPIFKNDLKNVILNGIVFAILGGILAGALDYLFDYINVSIHFGLIVLTILIGYRVYKAYFNFHILYPVLTIPFMILGLFIAFFTYWLCIFGIGNFFNILIDGEFYLSFIKSPVSTLITGIQIGNTGNIILGIVNILVYIIGFWACYVTAKGRR